MPIWHRLAKLSILILVGIIKKIFNERHDRLCPEKRWKNNSGGRGLIKYICLLIYVMKIVDQIGLTKNEHEIMIQVPNFILLSQKFNSIFFNINWGLKLCFLEWSFITKIFFQKHVDEIVYIDKLFIIVRIVIYLFISQFFHKNSIQFF